MRPGCPRCGMSQGYCFCEHVTPLDTRTQVCVIMHYKEAGRASNSGRLISMALSGGMAVTSVPTR